MLSWIKEKSGLNSPSKKEREREKKKDVTKATILYRNISKTSVHSPKYSIIHWLCIIKLFQTPESFLLRFYIRVLAISNFLQLYCYIFLWISWRFHFFFFLFLGIPKFESAPKFGGLYTYVGLWLVTFLTSLTFQLPPSHSRRERSGILSTCLLARVR